MTTSQQGIDKLAEALKGYVDTTKQSRQALSNPGSTPRPDNSDLLANFTTAAQRAAHTYANYTDEANTAMVAKNMAQLRADYLPQAQEIAGTQFDADRANLRAAVGVDYTSTTAMNAAQMKWGQIQQLLEHGQSWDTIIEQAPDTHTLAAIVEYAPTWLGTGKTGSQSVTMQGTDVTVPGHNMPLDDIDLLAARRAAELGSTPARSYVNARAQHAYTMSVGADIAKHLERQYSCDDMDSWADMYAHKAETMAARVTGEPTPNERIETERKSQARAKSQEAADQVFNGSGSGQDSDESPDALAAKVPRGY